ncbi:MAG: TolC family protein [Gammaproteobacteria bacterium]|nr:TolC family protein [Gammaproteobacteria bacterium]NBT43524.1 TolC family protein [Gammaproteobacteria bacterium]NBY23320.1 TolC family protein [Gammaproteobacteria bacterium]NDE33257.1 TolC family protein [Gammaproteobacteria bacterium]NDE55414.1 TolC family protein [Gammaproteobacteria bacterium]
MGPEVLAIVTMHHFFRLIRVGLSILLFTATVVAAPQNGSEKGTPHRGLSLNEAIDLAFVQNPDLAAAISRIGQAESRVAEVAAGFYPKVTARVGYDYTNNPALAFSYIVSQRRFNANSSDINSQVNNPGWVENFRPEVIGSINLYRGGQDDYLHKAAELGVKATELEHAALKNRLAAAVTAAFYAVISAPKQVEIAKRSILAVDKEVEHTRLKVEEGSALRGDVLSLEVRSRSAKESELQAINNVNLSRSALKSLLGDTGTELPEVRELEVPTPTLKENLKALFDEASNQRPELQAANHQIEIRQHELSAANGAILPRVNAYAAYGSNSRTLNPSNYEGNASIGINAELDLFAGGAINARISAAERRLAEAEAVEQKTRLEVEQQVRQAYSTLEQALERLKVSEAGAQSAEEALRLVKEQYHGGTATVTRYLEAETDRASAALRAVVTQFETQVAEAQLLEAIGHWR